MTQELNKNFYAAVKEGNLDLVKKLVEEGADVETTNTEGRSALARASKRGYDNVVAYLLERVLM